MLLWKNITNSLPSWSFKSQSHLNPGLINGVTMWHRIDTRELTTLLQHSNDPNIAFPAREDGNWIKYVMYNEEKPGWGGCATLGEVYHFHELKGKYEEEQYIYSVVSPAQKMDINVSVNDIVMHPEAYGLDDEALARLASMSHEKELLLLAAIPVEEVVAYTDQKEDLKAGKRVKNKRHEHDSDYPETYTQDDMVCVSSVIKWGIDHDSKKVIVAVVKAASEHPGQLQFNESLKRKIEEKPNSATEELMRLVREDYKDAFQKERKQRMVNE